MPTSTLVGTVCPCQACISTFSRKLSQWVYRLVWGARSRGCRAAGTSRRRSWSRRHPPHSRSSPLFTSHWEGMLPRWPGNELGTDRRPTWSTCRRGVLWRSMRFSTPPRLVRGPWRSIPRTPFLGFDVVEYGELVSVWRGRADAAYAHRTSRDFPQPGGRQAQRAYNDALRDLLAPNYYTGHPVVRIPVPGRTLDGALDRLIGALGRLQ